MCISWCADYTHFYFKTPPVPHIPLTALQTHKHVRDSADNPVPFMTLSSERVPNPRSRY